MGSYRCSLQFATKNLLLTNFYFIMEPRTSSDSEVMADLWGYDPTRGLPGGGSSGPGERASGSGRPGEHPEDDQELLPELASDASSSSVEDGFPCVSLCGCSDDGEAERKAREFGQGSYGCSHYRRRCLIVAPCCDEVFWCRHCHNEAKCANEKVCVCASLSNPPTGMIMLMRLSCPCCCLLERIPVAPPIESALSPSHVAIRTRTRATCVPLCWMNLTPLPTPSQALSLDLVMPVLL